MANNKIGFNYYNVDTDRYLDSKIKRLKKNLSCQGVAIYDYILSEIYRDKGCFIVWDESTAFDVAEYWNVKETLVNEVVAYCVSVGLFNKELFNSEKILSSNSILSRYKEMCIRAKRKNIIIPEKLQMLTEQSSKIQEECFKQTEVSNNREESKGKEREKTTPHRFSEEESLNIKIEQMLIPEMMNIWLDKKPNYYHHKEVDYPSLLTIAEAIAKFKGWKKATIVEANKTECLKSWKNIVEFIVQDNWYKDKDLSFFSMEKNWSGLVNKMIQKVNQSSQQINGKTKEQIENERRKTEQRTAQLASEG